VIQSPQFYAFCLLLQRNSHASRYCPACRTALESRLLERRHYLLSQFLQRGQRSTGCYSCFFEERRIQQERAAIDERMIRASNGLRFRPGPLRAISSS